MKAHKKIEISVKFECDFFLVICNQYSNKSSRQRFIYSLTFKLSTEVRQSYRFAVINYFKKCFKDLLIKSILHNHYTHLLAGIAQNYSTQFTQHFASMHKIISQITAQIYSRLSCSMSQVRGMMHLMHLSAAIPGGINPGDIQNSAGFADFCLQFLARDGGFGPLLRFRSKIHGERPAGFVTSPLP